MALSSAKGNQSFAKILSTTDTHTLLFEKSKEKIF
jgi:hypothetical protein